MDRYGRDMDGTSAADLRAAKDALGVSWDRLARAVGYYDGAGLRAVARRGSMPGTLARLLTVMLEVPEARAYLLGTPRRAG